MMTNTTSVQAISNVSAQAIYDQSLCQKIPAEYLRAVREMAQQTETEDRLSIKSLCKKLLGI